MGMITRFAGLCAALGLVSMLTLNAVAAEAVWPGFRGTGDSHAGATNLPLTWSEAENISWKCDLPGYGQSSPVVWKGQAFVTAVAGDNKETLIVAAVALDSGKLLWKQEFPATQKVKSSDYVSRGAPTPVVDSKSVYALFESGDLVALSHAGEKVWVRSLTTDYGQIEGNHGLGSSPAQTENAVIVLADHAGQSYLAAFNKETGETVWKKDRPSRVSWSSPIVTSGPAGDEILVSSNGVVQAFQAQDGSLLWEVTGLKGNTVASPSVTAENVLVGSGEPGHSVLIRRGGQGDVSETHVEWKSTSVSSSFGSPLVSEGRGYFVSKAGVAFAVRMDTGDVLWQQRLPDSTWASPIAAGDRVYFFCKGGETVVIKAGDTFEKLAQNKLSTADRAYGVAVTDHGFLIRMGTQLVSIEAPSPAGG